MAKLPEAAGSMSAPNLPSEVMALLERAASHPRGLQWLLRGNLESVAMLLGTHPAVVDEVRASLHDPVGRSELAEELVRVRGRGESPEPDPVAAQEVPELTAEGVLAAAAEVPNGEEFLFKAPMETVAVVFGVRPRVVEQARELGCVRAGLRAVDAVRSVL